MGTKVIYAEVEARSCTADLYVNGVPIPGVRRRTIFEKFGVSIQQWIVSDKNELTLVVDVEGSPSTNTAPREEKPRSDAQATGRFVEYEEGVIASPDNGRVLGQVTYLGSEDESEEAPRVRSISVDLPVQYGRWLWQDAPVLTLDDAARAEAVSVLESVQNALFGGDLGRMLDLVKVRWEEVDRAYPGRNDGDDRASLGSWLSELASEPHRRLPLRPSEHDFRLVAGGRVIECIDKDFMPSLRILQEIEPNRWAETPYPVYLARIQNRLTVVR